MIVAEAEPSGAELKRRASVGTRSWTWMRAIARVALPFALATAAAADTAPQAGSGNDPYRLSVGRHLVRDIDPFAAEGRIRVVVEIPAGTNAKWEVDKESGDIAWEFKKGRPRVVQYLAYPANYGMVPQTLLPKEEGGDGDPLDVVVLGPAVARGTVLEVRLVGVLRLLDGGEQDDKLLAVQSEGPLSDVASLAELDERYVGVTRILDLWFTNYKGPGKMESRGFGPADEALGLVTRTHQAYRAASQPTP